MDEFLRDIHTSVFKQWVLRQKSKYYRTYLNEKDHDVIIMENDDCYSYMTFNPLNIIELCVMNKATDEMEFYLHFQFKTMKHAVSLFYEMKNCIKKVINKPKCRVLLCCSGGMTTEFFAEKIRSAVSLLNLQMEVDAVGYSKVYEVGQNYDVILLAPQVSYIALQVEKALKNQIVLKIPPQIFAKYDVSAILDFIQNERNKHEKNNSYIEPIHSKKNIKNDKYILSVSVNENGDQAHISYRLYAPDQSIILDSKIIKNKIQFSDILDVIDTVILQNEQVDIISIALPGIIVDGKVSSGIIESIENENVKVLLKERYNRTVFIYNDVNAAAAGYYASQDSHENLAFLFQPIGRMAGSGIIINGQLVRGYGGLGGEVQFLPLQLSDDFLSLTLTPEGAMELVTKQLLGIISVVAPEELAIYCDLILDASVVEEKIHDYLNTRVKAMSPTVKKVENILEYILLGTMILSVKG